MHAQTAVYSNLHPLVHTTRLDLMDIYFFQTTLTIIPNNDFLKHDSLTWYDEGFMVFKCMMNKHEI